MQPSLLVVDDQEATRLFLAATLESRGYSVRLADTGAAALAAVEESLPDLVLLDLMLPDMNGMEVLARLREDDPSVRVIILTAFGRTDTAVQAMRLQAYDFVTKPINLRRLIAVIERGLADYAGRSARRLAQPSDDLFAVLPGAVPSEVPAMLALYATVRKLAASGRSTVLIEGESGAGKDILAQLIHLNSPRSGYPFLEINCASLPESLLESELFGHEKGAFTDASAQKLGLLELAHAGTLFLDEIGEMALPIQVKLLRVLEKLVFRRVGGIEDIRVDVRIVAATNQNLARLVQAKRFREDLYYRLKVVHLVVPPLRARREDIVPLAEHFLRHYNDEFGKRFTGFTAAAMDRLRAHAWPGNIRELRNTIERAALLEDADRLDAGHLGIEEPRHGAGIASLGDALMRALQEPLPADGVGLDGLLNAFEAAMLDRALQAAGNNKSQAARLLGLTRDRLRYRLAHHASVRRTPDEGDDEA